MMYHAGAVAKDMTNSTTWIPFGPVLELKIAWGQTNSGVDYLNMYARHLSQITFPIGGLLGVDDHTFAATPISACKRSVNLIGIKNLREAGRDSSKPSLPAQVGG